MTVERTSLRGRNCIVTGASRGLGRRIAETLRREGANLLLVARGAIDLSAGDPNVHVFQADLADPAAPAAILAAGRERWSSIDVVVNNAAVQGPIGDLTDVDWNDWMRALTIDFVAVAAMCRLAAAEMKVHGRGSIINISGGGATSSRPRFTAYAAAKTAVVRLTEVIADELQPHGVRVNAVAPGAMDTAMLREVVAAGEAAGEKELAAAARAIQTGAATEQRAAELVAFLASDASEGITGKLISATWDPWESLPQRVADLQSTDVYTLRRIVPSDRGLDW